MIYSQCTPTSDFRAQKMAKSEKCLDQQLNDVAYWVNESAKNIKQLLKSSDEAHTKFIEDLEKCLDQKMCPEKSEHDDRTTTKNLKKFNPFAK